MSSKNNPNVSSTALIVSSIFDIFCALPVLFFTAYVMTEVWNWWIVSLGVPRLNIWAAVGIDLVFALVRGAGQPPREEAAESQAVYEVSSNDAEYLLASAYVSLKRRFYVSLYILVTWGVAAGLHFGME